MVFSTMGTLGMSSDTRRFHNINRLSATIALDYVIFVGVVALSAPVSHVSLNKPATLLRYLGFLLRNTFILDA